MHRGMLNLNIPVTFKWVQQTEMKLAIGYILLAGQFFKNIFIEEVKLMNLL